MGTRGLMGVVVDGAEKLSYNHFDSYPSGLGATFLRDLFGLTDQPEKFLQQARDLTLVNEQSKPTPAQIAALSQHADPTVGSYSIANTVVHDWYQLLRNLQGDLAGTLAAGYMIDSRTFAYDSLFCEWGYVADLDLGVFQVYRGFRTEPPTRGRWSSPARKAAQTRYVNSQNYVPPTRYYAIDQVAEWSLTDLPTPDQFEEWAAEFDRREEEAYELSNA